MEEQTGAVLQLVAAGQQQPALFSLDIKVFVGRACCELRKLSAFAGTAIAIADLLTQIVQHRATALNCRTGGVSQPPTPK